MINSDLFSDDIFMELDDVTRLVWIGLIVMSADDQGRLQDNELLIKSQIFPMDNKSPDKIKSSLDILESHGMIFRYKSGNKKLIQIVNWWKHQTPSWASASAYPPPDGWIDREKYHIAGNKIATANWDTLGGFNGLHSRLPKRKVTGLVGNESEGDVNGEGECEGEGEGESSESDEIWLSFSEAFQELTNIKPKPTEPVVAMLAKFEELGVTVDEYRKAIQEMQAGGYTIASMTSPEKWVMNNRTNGNKKAVGYRQTRSISPELDEFLKDAPIFAEDIK
jgi:hypothetical protein